MKTNKEILKFALPAIIENFLQMLVGVSDTMIVAHLSLSAVAAVSLANNLITVYQAIFIALGTIISSLFAKVLIEKGKRKSKELINSATKLTILIGLVFGLFSFCCSTDSLFVGGSSASFRTFNHLSEFSGWFDCSFSFNDNFWGLFAG